MFAKSLLSVSTLLAAAEAISFKVSSSGGNSTSPYQYGLMFEDISHSGDGGVYAELIQNRAFQGDNIFPKTLDYWNALGGAQLSLQNLSLPLSSALSTSMQVAAENGSASTLGFSNEGYFGFPVQSSWEYQGSFWVHGKFDGQISVCLASYSNEKYAEAAVDVSSTIDGWKQFNYTLQPSMDAGNGNATLNFTFPASAMDGPVNFNLISLFPPTYNDRPNGLRVDLMEAMAGLAPSFFRMPGGNNIEGSASPHFWNWTQSIGPLEGRMGYPGTWGYENTNGLGLIEYLLWAQDLKMEPILGVWAGLYLDQEVVPESQIQPYVNLALDELEFLMGDASTPWGAKREALGHGPFEIKFVEVGNEDNLSGGKDSYDAYRFEIFYKAIKAAYPDITVISSYINTDGHPPPFGAAGDYHEYAVPVQMSSQFGFFDNFTTGHPILIGEYAVIENDHPNVSVVTWEAGAPRAFLPFWYGSVAEAIFLLGAERNSDKVIGASYAPGFQNLNSWAWVCDLIQFDANPAHTTLSTSYRVIELLSSVRITENLPTTISHGGYGPAYWVAGRSEVTGSHIMKSAVYNSSGDVPFSLSFDGVGRGAKADLTYLTAPMNSSNTIETEVVQTHKQVITADRRGTFNFKLPEYSVAVLEVAADSAGYGCDYRHPGSRHGWKGWKNSWHW